MSTGRENAKQQPPDSGVNLTGYPEKRLDSHAKLYRSHRKKYGAWYFSSSPGEGRFDVADPNGTCYLANTAVAAAMESAGPELIRHRVVSADFCSRWVISTLLLPRAVAAADLTATSPRHGVWGNQLSTAASYDLSCQWAESFRSAGFGGIWYPPRFSSITRRALALFGIAGPGFAADGFVEDPSPRSMASVLRRATGVDVETGPSPASMHVVTPPA